MATNNAVNTSLSSQTGTGNFVGHTSPTLVTPVLGAASATSLSFSSTSGIIGTTTNDNAAAGSVGEFISSNVLSASAVSLTSTVTADITSISLTAGDWDVFGWSSNNAGAGTTTSQFIVAINTTSATLPTPSPNAAFTGAAVIPSNPDQIFAFPTQKIRLSLSGTTTVYLMVNAIFAVSTLSAYGWIAARRVR